MQNSSYFYTQFGAYNTDWLVINIVLWLLLVTASLLVLTRPANEWSQVFTKSVLAIVFLWNGTVFFFIYMAESAFAGGIPFIIAGTLFAVDIFRKKIYICIPSAGWLRYTVIIMVIWGLGMYTTAGWISGHPYPGGPLPSAPCPATITAIALLLSSAGTPEKDRKDHILYILLFAMLLWWSLYAGIGASVIYGFYVDLTLLAAGLLGLAVLVRNRKNRRSEG